jgi:imidazolonepropionase-like amidohydrolase
MRMFATRFVVLMAAVAAALAPAVDPAAQSGAARPASDVTVIRAARLIDGRSDRPITDAAILVRGELIEAVGSRASIQVPAGAQVVDLGDQTLMPGLIDGHTHIAGRSDSTRREGQRILWTQDNGIQMTRAVRHARLNLLSGVTMSRVAGDPARTDFFLRDAVRDGRVPGPRIFPSGQWVSTTTGGTIRERRVNGPWEIIALIRNNLEDGAEQIKLIIYNKTPTSTNFTWEELQVAVDEVHRHGKLVLAHASGMPSIKQAIDAGVDTLEHGVGLTDDVIKELAAKQISIDVTTMAGYQGWFDEGWSYQDQQSKSVADWTNWMRALMRKVDQEPERQASIKRRQAELLKAHKAGVPIHVGLDNFHGLLSLEIEFLRDAGFTPMEALKAATSVPARVMRLGDKTGTLEAGKWADIISVRGDPLQDLARLSHVDFIMVGGKRYELSYR